MKVHEPSEQFLAKVMRGQNRLYLLHAKLVQPVCLVTQEAEEAWKWHARLGHVNMAAPQKMAREDLVRGLPALGQVDQLCEACLAGKHKRLTFPKQGEYWVRWVLELVHGDLCCPIALETPNGSKYFLLLVDDRSRYMWVVAPGAEEAWKWHARLGHVNMPALRKMAREDLVRGLPTVGQVDKMCEACLAGKQKRLPFPKQGE